MTAGLQLPTLGCLRLLDGLRTPHNCASFLQVMGKSVLFPSALPPLLSYPCFPHCPAPAAALALPPPRNLQALSACGAVAGYAQLLHILLHHPEILLAPTLVPFFWASPCVEACCGSAI
eukprot:1146279-Pelagomonas_calceolata.AAC.15